MKKIICISEVIKSHLEKLEVLNETQKKFLTLFAEENVKPNIEDLREIILVSQLYENMCLNLDFLKCYIEKEQKVEQEPLLDDKNIIYYRTTYDSEKNEIYIKLGKPSSGKVPIEILNFVDEIESTQYIMKSKCEEEEVRNYVGGRLRGIANIGGTSTYTTIAPTLLTKLKNDFVRAKWWEIKTPLVKKLGLVTFLQLLVLLTSICMLRLNALNIQKFIIDMGAVDSYIENWLFCLIGGAIGTWVSFSLFRNENNFDAFKNLSQNVPHPFLRQIVMSAVVSIFYIFFLTGLVNISFGAGENLNTKNIGMPLYENFALLVGLFLDLTENTIGENLRKRIDSLNNDKF